SSASASRGVTSSVYARLSLKREFVRTATLPDLTRESRAIRDAAASEQNVKQSDVLANFRVASLNLGGRRIRRELPQ
ncbi:MAG: hypothetical protein WC829_13425, partial [Hyphomicrobium sp.]